MEADSWTRHSAAARRLQSQYDNYLGFEEMDGGSEEEMKEYPCLYCTEEFDIVGLCIHIDDQHPVEAKNGVCPVCQVRFGTNMIAHMTVEHPSFFKMHRRKKGRKASSGTQSTISFLKKELREGSFQSLFGGSSYTAPPSSAAPDSLLSFINLPVASSFKDVQSETLEGVMATNISDEMVVESVEPSLSDKEHKEKTLRSEFVQGLIMSTISEFDEAS